MRIQRLILTALCGALLTMACNKEEQPSGIRTKDDTATSSNGKIPDYADDYSAISGWDYHAKWNLANVHDPSIAYFDGYYYMFCTDASFGNQHEKAPSGKHFQGKRSKDLVNWTYVQGVMDDAPAWVKEKLNSIRADMGLPAIEKPVYGYWAPVVRTIKTGGTEKLRMYYCIVIDNYIKSGAPSSSAFDGSWSERAFIGMCETTDPAGGKWEDKGFVTCSSSDRGRDGWGRKAANNWDAYFYFNAIDPTYLVDGDRHYLIYGSWHSGFAMLEINPATGMPLNTLGDPWADNAEDLQARYGVRVGTRALNSRWQGSEAPEIIKKDGYYYLFMAYDGLDVPYNTRVVRSDNIAGPYFDITGRNFTNGRGDCYPIVTHPYKFSNGYGWVGISHCAVFQQEGTGDWFYCSQGRLPAGAGGNSYANALMMGHVRRIVWCPSSADALDDLWPIALPERYAGVSNTKVKSSELTGKWEHIHLGYNHGVMDTAASLELKSDGTMTGALNGTWSFDEGRQFLTFAPSGAPRVVVCVAREADWEAEPRAATIVYAGTEKSLNATYWGKKVN